MRKSITRAVALATAASLFTAQFAVAQPFPPGHPPGPPPGAERYYYNGRWIGPDEWRRHDAYRDRWARNYERRRHRDRDSDSGAALIAGIIGFALGAAIVGSQQEAERARNADRSFDAFCARKYRSYDRRSRTYLGSDGLRHYCAGA